MYTFINNWSCKYVIVINVSIGRIKKKIIWLMLFIPCVKRFHEFIWMSRCITLSTWQNHVTKGRYIYKKMSYNTSTILSRTEEPTNSGTCARDRRALQQLALNVDVKHSDLIWLAQTTQSDIGGRGNGGGGGVNCTFVAKKQKSYWWLHSFHHFDAEVDFDTYNVK